MWGNATLGNFFSNNISVFTMLVGQISIWDLPKRIFDTLGVLGISLGLAFIPIVWWIIKQKTLKNELLWLFILPILYYATDLAPQTSKYFEASIAWGAIIAVLMLSKVNWKWALPVCLSALVLLGINGNAFDIGRTMDKNLAATEFYNKELPKIEDNGIFLTYAAWEWIETYYYNKEENKHIIPIVLGMLPNQTVRDMLRAKGVNLDDGLGIEDNNIRQVEIGLSIIADNPNVWTSRPTQPEVYGAEIILAKGNESEITKWRGSGEVNPTIQWKPSNPYDTISGSIEVEQWNFILKSNKTAMWLFVLAVGGFMVVWYVMTIIGKKSRKNKNEK
jgi:hypothetical protein